MYTFTFGQTFQISIKMKNRTELNFTTVEGEYENNRLWKNRVKETCKNQYDIFLTGDLWWPIQKKIA